MTARSLVFLKATGVLLAVLFAGLWARPWLIPGNFGDIYSYHYPLRHLVAATLQEGRLPLWNPYIFAGSPLAANSQAVAFYPLSVLHYHLPLSWAFTLDAMAHLGLATLGALLLLRRWGLPSAGAWSLSLSYGLSPFLVCRIAQGVPTHLAALAWVPWVWLAAAAVADGATPLLLSLVVALQILSGHPQFAALNLLALGMTVLAFRRRALPRLAAAAVPALGLAAVQVLPTLEFLRHSVRAVWDASLSLGYSIKLSNLLTLAWPEAFGDPLHGTFQSLYPSEFFEMDTLYLGLIPLALACLGARRCRPAWLLAAAGLFFSLGENNPAYLALQRHAGLDFLRVPARFELLILLGVWFAAAAGWRDAAARGSVRWKLALALLTAFDLAAWARGWVYAQDPKAFLSPDERAVAVLRSQGGRFATHPDILAPNKGMLYRLSNATGYEAFYLAPIARYTARSEHGPAADGSHTYIRQFDTPEMARLGVRWYLSPERVPCERTALSNGGVFMYHNPDARPWVQAPVGPDPAGGPINAERWEALSYGPAVTFSQAAYPGWRAWAGGRPVSLRDEAGMFPTARTEGGPGRPSPVVLLFRPASFRLGLLLTLLSAALSTALLAGLLRRRGPPAR